METTQSFVGGELLASRETYDNLDPATGRVLSRVARGGPEEVDLAVTTAARAQREWARTTPEQRATLLGRWADLVDRDAEALALTECEDTGKPLSQARTDTAVCARYLRFYAHAIETYYGRTIPRGPGSFAYTVREPFGVVGSIVAWNYPLQLASRTLAAAVATGNAAVLKPADETPRTAVALARLAVEAGLPPGVVNVVTGLGPEAGAALAAHEGVAHLGFVGSTEVGSLIAHAAADRVVPTVLELGGKSAQVVFADADLDRAAAAVVTGVIQNAGQTCSAGSRLVVHRDVRDRLLEDLVRRFEQVRLGPGPEDPDLGPLISPAQLERVRGYVDGNRQGTVLTGGRTPDDPRLRDGSFYLPTIVDGVDPTSPIAQEEVFGPVLVSMDFEDEEEAVALANGTAYGLLGAVWTNDLGRAHRTAAALRAGQVFVNSYGAGGGVELPFGGWGRSGYGREKGVEALDALTQTKTVVVHLGG